MSKFDLMLGIPPEPEPDKPKARKKRSKKQVYSDAYDDDSFQDRRGDLRRERDTARRSQMLETAAQDAARLSVAREQRRARRDHRRNNRERKTQRRQQQLESLRLQLAELDGMEPTNVSSYRRLRWHVMIPISIPVRGVTRIEIPLTPAIIAHHWGRDRIWLECEEPTQLLAGIRLTIIGRTRARTRYTITEVRRSGRVIIEQQTP